MEQGPLLYTFVIVMHKVACMQNHSLAHYILILPNTF